MKSFVIIIKTTFAVKAVTWIKKKYNNLWQENKFQKYTLTVNKFEFKICIVVPIYTIYSLIVYLFSCY